MEIWTGLTDAWHTDSQTLKDSATQLLIKYKSGALVTQFNKIKSGCKNPNSWCQPVLHNELWEIEVSQEFVLKLMEKVWSTKFLLTEDPSRLGMKTFSWSFIAGPSLFSRSYIYIFPFFSPSKTSVRPWQVSAKCCGWDRRKNAVKEKLFFVKSIFFFLGRFLHTSGKSGQ